MTGIAVPGDRIEPLRLVSGRSAKERGDPLGQPAHRLVPRSVAHRAGEDRAVGRRMELHDHASTAS
jgi:hypothetical protein